MQTPVNPPFFTHQKRSASALSPGRRNVVGFIGLFPIAAIAVLCLFAIVAATGSSMAAEISVLRGLPAAVSLERPGGVGGGAPTDDLTQEVILVLADGGRQLLRFSDRQFAALDIEVSGENRDLRPDLLPDGEVTRGAQDIFEAWLTGPTDRYTHGILGDRIEAASVTVLDENGRISRIVLESDAVFEDRRARLVDLDGDGHDEVIVVKSWLAAGAALAVLGLGPNGLEMVAETPPIGTPRRWLNPVGAGDFDGDGRTEIAFVVTPHIGGTLVLQEFSGGALTFDYSEFGFSNHVIGSREQGLSTVVRWNRDGVADLAVPSADRTTMRIVTFAGGEFAELASIMLPSRVVGAVIATDMDGNGAPELLFAVEDGTLIWLKP
jgi:hypothetical protein